MRLRLPYLYLRWDGGGGGGAFDPWLDWWMVLRLEKLRFRVAVLADWMVGDCSVWMRRQRAMDRLL